jgi:beta-lactamase superfamily II metal-dependent hydrolase
MKRLPALAVLLCGLFYGAAGAADLTIYFVDVEGGAATLVVTPAGQSMLVDTGNPAPDDRDAKRILLAAQAAGLKTIDYLWTTHFDGDHVGGAPAVAKMIPIEHFVDRGDSIQADTPGGKKLWDAYLGLAAGKRTSMKPGERLPLKGVEVTAVSSNGRVLDHAINGGKANPLCEGAQNKDVDTTENNLSLGLLLTFGKFRFLDVGDLTWSKEMELACPVNKLGKVTLYQATHHGFFNDRSGAPAHLYAIQPQVVIINNGPRKGLTTPDLYERIAKIPGIEGIWQAHLTLGSDRAHNTSEDQIANMEPTAECRGNWIKVVVHADGAFTVTNGRNGFSRNYQALAR